MGVKEGDIVSICLPNMPEAIYVFYACNKIGAVADFIHPLSSPEQLKLYLEENQNDKKTKTIKKNEEIKNDEKEYKNDKNDKEKKIGNKDGEIEINKKIFR